jgi:hypothetical protein
MQSYRMIGDYARGSFQRNCLDDYLFLTTFAIRELQIGYTDMKNHNGMRPQDVVILLKLSTMKSESLRFADIAAYLKISASEITESLERSLMARLVTEDKREIYCDSFFEFLVYGM